MTVVIGSFRGGPANGKTLVFGRAPLYLRAITVPEVGDLASGLDVLDQIDDTPGPREIIHVYRLHARSRPVHVCQRPGGCTTTIWVEYRHHPANLRVADYQRLRSNRAWQAWAQTQPARTVVEIPPNLGSIAQEAECARP